MNPTETTRNLLDADTTEFVSIATAAQIEASDAAGDTGIIRIDSDGDVVEPGSWSYDQPGTRTVYVEA